MKDKGCYQCEERHYLCHSTCEKYKEWKAKRDELQAAIRKETEEQYKLNETAILARLRARRRRD